MPRHRLIIYGFRPGGECAFAETGHHRIRVVTKKGLTTTLAGHGAPPDPAEAAAGLPHIRHPSGDGGTGEEDGDTGEEDGDG